MLKIIDMKKDGGAELYERLLSRNRMEAADVLEAVSQVIAGVRSRGDEALVGYTRRFDRVEIGVKDLKVTDEEISRAYKDVDPELLEVIRRARTNIRDFHEKQKEKSWFTSEKEGVILGQVIRPLETIGVYVPGGTAPLISSVLMNVVPACAAGVSRIVMATPPMKDGRINPAVLVAAAEAGVHEIYRMGGAQAIAAMAFGTDTVPKVDKIFGPGNIYVATAKRMVFGYVDIDMFAGPSEITVIADETAEPAFVAADLLSQAEHDVLASSILITTSEELARKVCIEIERQTAYLGRKDIIEKALGSYGMAVIAESLEEAVEISNRIAPEHLELCVADPFSLLGNVKNAGAIFLGRYASEPLGDYFAGPNHILPTSGTARFFSPLNLSDFIKKSSIISYTKKALGSVKDDVIRFAEAEGLGAHANAIRVRFENDKEHEVKVDSAKSR